MTNHSHEVSQAQEVLSELYDNSTGNEAIAIKVENLSKIYPLYNKPIDRMKEALHPYRKKYHRDFYALSDISLEIKKGDTIGIIGQNGSGKSTLLKIITGVLTPSSGHIHVNGRISSLLELGTGFNNELTGIENIYFHGTINGYTSEEMDTKIDGILSFADIGEFIYQPVKMYSSGMFVRLAFAVAIAIDPEILIVDEALSVGDAYFQVKSMNKMKRLIESGCTVLFVSHDASSVRTLCKGAHLLHEGKLLYSGVPLEVFDFYNSLISLKHKGITIEESGGIKSKVKQEDFSEEEKKDEFKSLGKRTGNLKMEILSIKMVNNKSIEVDSFVTGENVEIQIIAKANEDIPNPTFGIAIRDRLGNDIFGVNNMTLYQDSPSCKKGKTYYVSYSFQLNIGLGVYSLTVAIHDDRTHINNCYDWINDALVFNISSSPEFQFTGFCRIKPDFMVKEV